MIDGAKWLVNKTEPKDTSETFEGTDGFKKGKIGEGIIYTLLKQDGYTIFPADKGRHPVDYGVMDPNNQRYWVEVKTKEPLNGYTGFNESNFLEYKELWEKYGEDIRCMWVDYIIKSVYGGFLMTELEVNADPRIWSGPPPIKVYRVADMTTYYDISGERFANQLNEIKSLTHNNQYKNPNLAEDGQIK